jgi:hypothetical protein
MSPERCAILKITGIGNVRRQLHYEAQVASVLCHGLGRTGSEAGGQ